MTSPYLYYLNFVLLYLCLDATPLGHILIILLDGLLHGKYLTFFTLELFKQHTEGGFLEGLFKICLFLIIFREGKDRLEGWIVTIVVLQKLVLV